MIKWEGKIYEKDWRTDGYNWRQQRGAVPYVLDKKHLYKEGSEEFKLAENDEMKLRFSRLTFKLRINSGEGPESFTTEFNKKAYQLEDYRTQILVVYEGDPSVINPKYSHGNAKREEKTQKPYIRTLKSVLDTAKEREDEQPTEVYLDLIKKVGENMKKQAVHAPRDLKQIENAQRNNR